MHKKYRDIFNTKRENMSNTKYKNNIDTALVGPKDQDESSLYPVKLICQRAEDIEERLVQE